MYLFFHALIDCLKWPCWPGLWIVSLFDGFNHVNIGVSIFDLCM
jgi:hypothetical protein